MFELLQYAPTTEKVHEVPLLIFPPWINKFYILDLQPKNSMISWLTDQGHTVFLVSWVNPGEDMAEVYVRRLHARRHLRRRRSRDQGAPASIA